MDELINLVSKKTGLSPDKARTAAETVIGFLKDRLPGPIAGQLDNALGSGNGKGEREKQGLGDMLGR